MDRTFYKDMVVPIHHSWRNETIISRENEYRMLKKAIEKGFQKKGLDSMLCSPAGTSVGAGYVTKHLEQLYCFCNL